MSERQVQYTDGSWSREVEVTDHLLDRARRQVCGIEDPSVRERLIIDLIERVQQAEAALQEWAYLWQQASMSVLTLQDEAKTLTRERDEARGKLDKVRALADEAPDNLLDELRTLLAILDGKTGD